MSKCINMQGWGREKKFAFSIINFSNKIFLMNPSKVLCRQVKKKGQKSTIKE